MAGVKKCCGAWKAWRAGVTPEDARLIYDIGCKEEEMLTCRKCWLIKEKIDLYNAQSNMALDGDSKLLQHLGRAILNQDQPVAEDPGIGDIVFMLPQQAPKVIEAAQPKALEEGGK